MVLGLGGGGGVASGGGGALEAGLAGFRAFVFGGLDQQLSCMVCWEVSQKAMTENSVQASKPVVTRLAMQSLKGQDPNKGRG
jgi:hypothetical protein